MTVEYNFYEVSINTPLSVYNNTNQWNNSLIGQLNSKTDGQVYIDEIDSRDADKADYYWRVVDAWYSQEDSLITYFRAYDLNGILLPQATFGVTYSTVPQTISTAGFKYRPKANSRYYYPVENKMQTQNTGGYTVVVLSKDYPSEGMAFGMYKQGDQHQNLVISFRLFAKGNAGDYPNDYVTP